MTFLPAKTITDLQALAEKKKELQIRDITTVTGAPMRGHQSLQPHPHPPHPVAGK